MLNDAQKQMLVSAACMGVLVFLAFFGAYAGQTFSQPPIPRPLKIEQAPQAETANPNDDTNANRRGTENSPFVVKVLPTPKTAEEAANDQQDRDEKTSSDWWLIRLTGVLALVGLLQLITFGVQAHRLKQTVDAMQIQSADMKSSITQATRASDAMEGVAASLKINADEIVKSVKTSRDIAISQREFGELQLRAHVCVNIGIATYQDARNRFAAGPIFLNTGHTAARKFRFRVKADILSVPLPIGFKFTLPPRNKASSILPPQQPREAYTIVDQSIDVSDVSNVKTGIGRSLYVWGTADYEDVFGKTKRLTFLQQICWVGEPGKEGVRGVYLNKHNHAN